MADPFVKTPNLRSLVQGASSPEQLAAVLIGERTRLKDRNQVRPRGLRSCRALTDVCDLILQRMLFLALPTDPVQREGVRPMISIAATGGYGRRELCPQSDIDVTFVVASESDPLLDATVKQMFLWLMEIFSQRAGLKIGYAYRSSSDAVSLDHQTQTALVDLRVVAGSHRLGEQFRTEVMRNLWPAAFIRTKLDERLRMREKRGGVLHVIEPDVKDGVGGLRDIQLAEWMAVASFPSTRGDVWRQLQRLGAVAPSDVDALDAARDFLLTVRNWMHWDTGRAADLLVRERQDRLAEALGFQSDREASCVERFMERYYREAERVEQVSEFVIERCLAERLSLTEELTCSGEDLHAAYPWVRVAEPHFLVSLGRHFQAYGLKPGYELRRMIAQHLDNCPPLTADEEAAEDLIALFKAPPPPPTPDSCVCRPGVYATLRLLTDLGILQRLLPELGMAYRRVPFDPIHKHTIGFHSLETVRRLELLRGLHDENNRELESAWASVDSPVILYLATLLHDVGKLASTPGHCEEGERIARTVASRLRLEPETVDRVAALVRNHMLMSETAQLRDLTLDRTMQDFTQAVNTPEMLNMLLLLTHADMDATGVLSPVKVQFLLDLYYRAEPIVNGNVASVTPEPGWERRYVARLSRRLSTTSLTPDQIRVYAEGMPLSYLLNTRPDQVARHIRMLESLQTHPSVVEFENEGGSAITSIHICTPEHPGPGLLSRIAGVLYAHEISVHGAQVFTRQSDPPIALDTIWADFHGRPIPPFKCLELEQDLLAVLHDGDVQAVLGRYRKQVPAADRPSSLRFNNTLSDGHTVIEMRSDDQPALLYRITRALAALGWNIHSARISTRGDEARDAFYVTGPDGGKLEDEESSLEAAFLEEFSA